MRHRANVLCLLAGLCVALATPAFALPEDIEQEVNISADQARFEEKTGLATYSGNVIVEQGTLRVTGKQLIIQINDNGSMKLARMLGEQATYQQKIDPQKGMVKARANTIIFNTQQETITLTGNATLTQDGATFSGPNIVYSTRNKQVDASGSPDQRVKLVLPPNFSKKPATPEVKP